MTMPINRSGSINEDFKEFRRTNANLENKSQSLHSTSGNFISCMKEKDLILQTSTELENIYANCPKLNMNEEK